MARPSPTPCRVCYTYRLCVLFNKFSHFRQNLQQQLGVRGTGTYRAELWRGPEDGEEDTFVKAFMIAYYTILR